MMWSPRQACRFAQLKLSKLDSKISVARLAINHFGGSPIGLTAVRDTPASRQPLRHGVAFIKPGTMPGVPQEDNTGRQRICDTVLQANAEEERQAKGLRRHRATAGRHEGVRQGR